MKFEFSDLATEMRMNSAQIEARLNEKIESLLKETTVNYEENEDGASDLVLSEMQLPSLDPHHCFSTPASPNLRQSMDATIKSQGE